MENTIIGRVIATENKPTTIDNFTFWTDQRLVLNPFDIVKIEHVNGSFSYGQVENISHITDAASFLSSYVSNDFGDVNVQAPTFRVGMNYVEAKILCNTKNVYIPLQNDAKVFLASAEEIQYALGLNKIKNHLCCGYLDMYEGTNKCEKVTLPVWLDSRFLIGPEGAHLNISGISGLASKTSYAMFLMKAIQDRYISEDPNDDSVAFVMFNVKGKDLLAIDQLNDFSDFENPKEIKEMTLRLYKQLGLTDEPFRHVSYYYPYSDGAYESTYLSKEDVETNVSAGKAYRYKYLYEYDKDNLDLIFSNIDDPNQTMDAVISKVINGEGKFEGIRSWSDFLDTVKEYMTSKVAATDTEIMKASWKKFYRIVNKAIYQNPLFANRLIGQTEVRLNESLKHIKKNEIRVIDIAKLSEDKQAFVFGDVVRTIYNLQLGEYVNEDGVNPPSKIVIFIDELNKYASTDAPKNSPILRELLDVTERGRSLGVILFSAEQFRSAIKDRITGNCATHAYGRTNDIESAKNDYKSIPSVYKSMLTRLEQGHYIVQNPVFRSLLNIKFPLPIYKQFK